MDRIKHRQLTRQIWREHVRAWVLPVLIGGSTIAALLAVSLNVPLSSRQMLCDYQRLSYPASNYSWSRPVAFCDLPDGRTVMIRVRNGWVPPLAGSAIKIIEDKLVFGQHYRLAPQREG